MLLVEDNPTDVYVIQEVIQSSGVDCNLQIVKNGQDALQYLQGLSELDRQLYPVLVLLDLNLPKVPGIEVLRCLRVESHCRKTPVIVVTSSTAESDRNAVDKLGVSAYFQKPSSLAAYMQLGSLIQSVLTPQASESTQD